MVPDASRSVACTYFISAAEDDTPEFVGLMESATSPPPGSAALIMHKATVSSLREDKWENKSKQRINRAKSKQTSYLQDTHAQKQIALIIPGVCSLPPHTLTTPTLQHEVHEAARRGRVHKLYAYK